MISPSGRLFRRAAGASMIGVLCPCIIGFAAAPDALDRGGAYAAAASPRIVNLAGGRHESLDLGELNAGETYALVVSVEGHPLGAEVRVRAQLDGPGTERLAKELDAGDPDYYLAYRPRKDGRATLTLSRPPDAGAERLKVRVDWRPLGLPAADRAAFEAEPNDSWKDANELVLGRDVYGSADDVNYLENEDEGKRGLDWFRFEVSEKQPILVYFQLDLLDRDVSANLRVYVADSKTGRPQPYLAGKDPMEIVHDRERERYSKHISRTFQRGTYYLEVNANHPDYILRTRVLPVPPYQDPTQAVEAGMHYIINVGDAWFAQIPREGNIFVRSANMHDTAMRCTACHPSSFSTEANLAAHRNGYPIRSKSNFQYVVDRLYNSITPLYGDDGLYWQRFIAIPLQAQGKQGAILLDFERQVSKQPTKIVERFGPFLEKAWATRAAMPADEQNGVIPLDSKFGFAWRDWRVLTELGARTGRNEFAQAAGRIAAIVGERAADKRVETLQDRIHRLYCWWLFDKAKFASKIKRETGALLTYQNEDGGWHESDDGPGASAVYTTGQLVWTLLQIGKSRDDPAIAKALRYLLSQQQDFGGWFQTTTHENFRTPMRETRYAVMALAEAFPGPGGLHSGWGNRDLGPARLPRSDRLLHTLDDLENLWDVPESDRPRFASAITPLLDHSEPRVRAAAAAALGRLGQADTARSLARRLADPSKIVWRASAWALRRLGNSGIGLDVIRAALKDPDPRVRRGAVRIFAYQFPGMDEHVDLAEQLIELTKDRDLWTRLQAARSLRQWFYRARDAGLKRRIVETYLARMAEPDAAVVRKNLSEGLYIMLDENLGGGVSLQKNIAELPANFRAPILEARKSIERDVLLGPVLAALKTGNDLARAGVLAAFDGSFFKGRYYARQPEAMIDVGNDREFGFLFQPSLGELESAFIPLLQAELPPRARQQALRLASFFRLPSGTQRPSVQTAILRRLSDPDQAVQATARAIVSSELELARIEDNPAQMALIRTALRANDDARQAILPVIGRNKNLAVRPEIQSAIRDLVVHDVGLPTLLPVLKSPVVRDIEVVSLLLHDWSKLDPAQRLEAIEAVFSRPALVDVGEPREPVMQVLRRAISDPSATVRDRTLRGVNALPALWAGAGSTAILLAALADDLPSIRRMGLTLASSKSGFWKRPDAAEHLKRLLIDPDSQVRAAALATVAEQRLIPDTPGLARRVKALQADANLKGRAMSILVAQGVNPAEIQPDLPLGRPRLLGFSAFRRKVNPLFYQAGDDGYACVNCHQNHTILRIAESGHASRDSGDQLMINYSSALKVVNLGDPESSLLLRKPRSPQGQGGPEPASPTGLTHVGGPRWESTDHPAYQAILDWIREASQAVESQATAAAYSADSFAPDYAPSQAGDGDPATYWHTEFIGATPGFPHELVVDLGSPRSVEGLLYVPRQDSPNGRVKDFEILVSTDGKTWSAPVAKGTWPNEPSFQYVSIPVQTARFVQLRGLAEVEGRPVMSAAEISIESTPLPAQPAFRP
jgi:HEAT repeat protein